MTSQDLRVCTLVTDSEGMRTLSPEELLAYESHIRDSTDVDCACASVPGRKAPGFAEPRLPPVKCQNWIYKNTNK